MDITFFFFIGFIVFALILAVFVMYLAGKHKITERNKKFITKEWGKITSISRSNPEIALMNADKLLDHALKIMGYSGTLGDKLKKCGSFFHDLNGIWEAHKMRNQLAHEVGSKLSQSECEKYLSKFKRAFRDLGVNL
jgi:hypothetical protein